MEESNTINQKPSCPKEFFAKLYGHLEEDKNKIKENEDEKKDDSENSKNDDNFDLLKKIKFLDEVKKYGDLDRKLFVNSELVQRVPPPFPFLSTIVSSSVSTFCTDSTFSSGITTFLERRRRKEGRPRRQRTTFSSGQTLSLELEYHRSEYISRGRRFELAESLQLTETQIKIWFQNRRAKDKRIEKAQIDQQYRNLLLSSGINGFGIARNNVNFCGICMYRNKLSPGGGNVPEFFNHNCGSDRQPFSISENLSALDNQN